MANAPATPQQVVGALQSMGFSRAGAAAITGNLEQESGLNPNVGQHGTSQTAANLGSGAGGYGLAQWTSPSRQLGLTHYADSTKQPVSSLGTQLGYLKNELTTQYPGLTKSLETGNNVNALTNQFEQQYERAGDPNLGARLSDAQKALAAAGGTTTYTTTTAKPPASAAGLVSNNLGAALSAAYRTGSTVAQHGLASQLQSALDRRAAVLQPGVTQTITNDHLSAISQLGDDPHTLALAGAMAISHDPRLSEFNRIVTSANNISNTGYNYEWGGGHNANFTPTTGTGHGSGSGVGYDCSGVLSHVLHMAGVLNQPLVAGQFAHLGDYVPQAKPGVGTGPHTITIYANADHTFANIGGTYFGTSTENRGGGAGWIGSTSENNNADFTAWHIDF